MITSETSSVFPDVTDSCTTRLESVRAETQKKEQDPRTLKQRGREDGSTASSQKNRKAQALKMNLVKRKQQQRSRSLLSADKD